jgi:predicted nucleic-acid-binding protein
VIDIDTDVLVLVLTDEPSQAAQITAARALMAEARNSASQAVLVENFGVLESAYQLPKAEVLRALDHLLANAAFDLEAESRFRAAVRLFHETNTNSGDGLPSLHSELVGTQTIMVA